ncbi:class I SAM-dependent methyltransferase [Paenibacillus macerans]|uniref:class I SAM-dependent methyltransferase n=1 Tax=Paenibacillus macerans TaxID=44252 RepID=UPI00203DCCD3|nr:class I SAM-dependent methyltransferase [Paenibacillus macerans]MCM3698745.1 methyltransferase domain-containing protein [Paenibacillus macerans]
MQYFDMLSRLGEGSAHPGGFAATIEQFNKYKPSVDGTILEIGCGTGRTACYLAEQGYRVVAVDIHPDILAKAKKRASTMGVEVDFLLADAHDLPFPDETFQAVLVESVTNFTQAQQSLSEYFRVLKSGGVFYDREMFVRHLAPAEIVTELKSFFPMPSIMNRDEWSAALTERGFTNVEFLEVSGLGDDKLGQQYEHPDDHQIIDEGSFLDFKLMECASRSSNIIIENKEHLEYGIIRAFKAEVNS